MGGNHDGFLWLCCALRRQKWGVSIRAWESVHVCIYMYVDVCVNSCCILETLLFCVDHSNKAQQEPPVVQSTRGPVQWLSSHTCFALQTYHGGSSLHLSRRHVCSLVMRKQSEESASLTSSGLPSPLWSNALLPRGSPSNAFSILFFCFS